MIIVSPHQGSRGTRTQLPGPLLELPHDRLQVADTLVEDVDLVLVLVDVGVLPRQSISNAQDGIGRDTRLCVHFWLRYSLSVPSPSAAFAMAW